MNSYTEQREIARAALLAKVRKTEPAPFVPGVDASLKDDTLTLYNAIAEKIGMYAFGEWLTLEHPYLLSPHVGLLRTWWILQRFHDDLMGIQHLGWTIQTSEVSP